MEIPLYRVDYAQVGTTSKGCLRLLPGAVEKETKGIPLERVVVGSHSGVILCLSRKRSDTQVVFKTLPGPKIECVQLGGALGTVQDKIFVAMANTVKGFSKKGKQFFAFETNMTEPISSMHIYGVDMLLCGKNTFNHYHDCAEANYYLCGDKINDVLCLPIVEGSWVGRGLTPVIAWFDSDSLSLSASFTPIIMQCYSDDKTVKVLDGSHLAYQVELGGIPNVLHLFINNGGPQGQLVLYGTKDGRVGLVDLPAKNGSCKWEITSGTGSAVTALNCYPMTNSGGPDLIVGKDDGLIEIYNIDAQDRVSLRQTHQCDESITGLQCGRVNANNFDEIIVCTYTGWIFGLTTEPIQKQIGQDEQFTLNPDMEIKVQNLKQELEELQTRVTEEREKYHEMTLTETSDGLSAVPLFAINDRFALSKDEAAYTLSVELIVPIDYVLLQCDVPVDLLDVDKNSAVVSLTPCEPNSGNALLATYRCQANTTRMEMKIRSIEGQYGTLQAYVSPKSHPKMCQVRQYNIKPLSLHQRAHNYDSSRPQNTLKLSGQFSMAEAHSWVHFCLPETPEKVPPTDQAHFSFTSTFTATQLQAVYSKGLATFQSDNLSTIAILRDVLGKEATKKKLKVDISCDINEESIAHTLQLLHPKLEYQLTLAKKVHLAQALKELEMSQNDMSFLSEEFLDILRRADELSLEHKKQTAHLERIYGVVTDLYIDKYKFAGVNVKNRIPQLLQTLDSYSFETLLAFFQKQNS